MLFFQHRKATLAKHRGNSMTLLLTSLAILSASLATTTVTLTPLIPRGATLNSNYQMGVEAADHQLDEIEQAMRANAPVLMNANNWTTGVSLPTSAWTNQSVSLADGTTATLNLSSSNLPTYVQLFNPNALTSGSPSVSPYQCIFGAPSSTTIPYTFGTFGFTPTSTGNQCNASQLLYYQTTASTNVPIVNGSNVPIVSEVFQGTAGSSPSPSSIVRFMPPFQNIFRITVVANTGMSTVTRSRLVSLNPQTCNINATKPSSKTLLTDSGATASPGLYAITKTIGPAMQMGVSLNSDTATNTNQSKQICFLPSVNSSKNNGVLSCTPIPNTSQSAYQWTSSWLLNAGSTGPGASNDFALSLSENASGFYSLNLILDNPSSSISSNNIFSSVYTPNFTFQQSNVGNTQNWSLDNDNDFASEILPPVVGSSNPYKAIIFYLDQNTHILEMAHASWTTSAPTSSSTTPKDTNNIFTVSSAYPDFCSAVDNTGSGGGHPCAVTGNASNNVPAIFGNGTQAGEDPLFANNTSGNTITQSFGYSTKSHQLAVAEYLTDSYTPIVIAEQVSPNSGTTTPEATFSPWNNGASNFSDPPQPTAPNSDLVLPQWSGSGPMPVQFGKPVSSKAGDFIVIPALITNGTSTPWVDIFAFNTMGYGINNNNQLGPQYLYNTNTYSNIAAIMKLNGSEYTTVAGSGGVNNQPYIQSLSNVDIWYNNVNNKFYWLIDDPSGQKSNKTLFEWDPASWGNGSTSTGQLNAQGQYYSIYNQTHDVTTIGTSTNTSNPTNISYTGVFYTVRMISDLNSIELWASGGPPPYTLYNPTSNEYYIQTIGPASTTNASLAIVGLNTGIVLDSTLINGGSDNSNFAYLPSNYGISMMIDPYSGILYFTQVDPKNNYWLDLMYYDPKLNMPQISAGTPFTGEVVQKFDSNTGNTPGTYGNGVYGNGNLMYNTNSGEIYMLSVNGNTVTMEANSPLCYGSEFGNVGIPGFYNNNPNINAASTTNNIFKETPNPPIDVTEW